MLWLISRRLFAMSCYPYRAQGDGLSANTVRTLHSANDVSDTRPSSQVSAFIHSMHSHETQPNKKVGTRDWVSESVPRLPAPHRVARRCAACKLIQAWSNQGSSTSGSIPADEGGRRQEAAVVDGRTRPSSRSTVPWGVRAHCIVSPTHQWCVGCCAGPSALTGT